MEPEWRKNRAKFLKSAVWPPRLVPGGVLPRVNHPKSSIFGSPWGPQIDQKSTCGPPKCGRSCFLSDFYSMLRLAQFSDSIWGRIFMKNQCFFQCDFPEILFFFQPGDPHQTLYFTSRNLLFHFFIFSFFHRKND